jgi:hypothetical protein
MRLFVPSVLVFSIVLLATVMACDVLNDYRRREAVLAGEYCVTYRDSWLGPVIDQSFKPRHGFVDYCLESDAPPHTGNIGQLLGLH